MAQYIDYGNYQAMIDALNTFIQKVSEGCDMMAGSARECVDNTSGDDAVQVASGKLDSCIKRYEAVLETARQLIADMQAEMEDADNARRIMDSE